MSERYKKTSHDYVKMSMETYSSNNVNNIVNNYKKMTLGSNGGLDASGTVYINNAYDVKKEDPGLSWIN